MLKESTSVETAPDRTTVVHSTEEAVLAGYMASLNNPGRRLSQRALSEMHGIDRRKVKEIIPKVA